MVWFVSNTYRGLEFVLPPTLINQQAQTRSDCREL